MSEGPFTDAMVKHYVTAMQTREGIREAAEKMAEILAEMGRASKKSTGDSPAYAVKQWATLIEKRALELLRGDEPAKLTAMKDRMLEQK